MSGQNKNTHTNPSQFRLTFEHALDINEQKVKQYTDFLSSVFSKTY